MEERRESRVTTERRRYPMGYIPGVLRAADAHGIGDRFPTIHSDWYVQCSREAAAKCGEEYKTRARILIYRKYSTCIYISAICALRRHGASPSPTMSMRSLGIFLRCEMSRDSLNPTEACYELS